MLDCLSIACWRYKCCNPCIFVAHSLDAYKQFFSFFTLVKFFPFRRLSSHILEISLIQKNLCRSTTQTKCFCSNIWRRDSVARIYLWKTNRPMSRWDIFSGQWELWYTKIKFIFWLNCVAEWKLFLSADLRFEEIFKRFRVWSHCQTLREWTSLARIAGEEPTERRRENDSFMLSLAREKFSPTFSPH